MTFSIGQQVVCIDDNLAGGYGDETDPVLRGVYTIRQIYWNGHRGCEQVLFHEIVNTPRWYLGFGFPVEGGFDSHHFRPLRTTSIEIFRSMLVPSKVTA